MAHALPKARALLATALLAARLLLAVAAPIVWDGVDATVEAFDVYPSFGVIIGNGSGVLHTYSKGGFDLDASIAVASASKWVAASIVQRIVEETAGNGERALVYDSRPVDWLAAWAGIADGDARHNVTLRMLLSFTDGMDSSARCAESPTHLLSTWDVCQEEIVADFDGGLPYAPGSTFHYGSVHLNVAVAMAAVADGAPASNPWNGLYVAYARDPLGLGLDSWYQPLYNPLIGGGLAISPQDYAKWLAAYFDGSFFADPVASTAAMETDYTREAAFGYTPTPDFDTHYGAGHWIECRRNSTSSNGGDGAADICNSRSCTSPPAVDWLEPCSAPCEQSSIGLYGFYPYLDRCFGRTTGVTQGYWAIVAVEDGNYLVSGEFGDVFWPAVREAFLTQLQKGA